MMQKTRLSISKAVQAIALVAVLVLTGGIAQAEWTAYNDCVFDSTVPTGTDPNGQTVHYTGSNVTTFGVGNVTADYGGTAETAGQPYLNNSGTLVNQSDGSATGATLTVGQNGSVPVIWQPQVAVTWTGGYDTALATDARNTFGGIADMTGVSHCRQFWLAQADQESCRSPADLHRRERQIGHHGPAKHG